MSKMYNRMTTSINLVESVVRKYDREIMFNNNPILYYLNKLFSTESESKEYIGLYRINDSIRVDHLVPDPLKREYIEEHYINCNQYIENNITNCTRYEVTVNKEKVIDFIYNLLNQDYAKKIMGMLVLNLTDSKEYANITHPLIMLDFMFKTSIEEKRKDTSYNEPKFKIILFEYLDEYLEKDNDQDNIQKYFAAMKDILIKLSAMKIESIDQERKEEKEVKYAYITCKLDQLYSKYNSDTISSKFIIPVDRMASIATVPFYGWNYIEHKEVYSMKGFPLFNYINLTGNLSINIGTKNYLGNYCTGSLPKNMIGLNSLKGNNLSSAYRNNCIDITKNYSWIQANLLATKFLIETYKGIKI